MFSFIIRIKSCHLTNDELFQPLHSHAPSQNPSDGREARIIPVSTKSSNVYSQILITCINVVYKARGSWASLLTLTFQAIISMKKTLSCKHLGSEYFSKDNPSSNLINWSNKILSSGEFMSQCEKLNNSSQHSKLLILWIKLNIGVHY